jgi:hypothetical protein
LQAPPVVLVFTVATKEQVAVLPAASRAV